jgi:hypothetical protein
MHAFSQHIAVMHKQLPMVDWLMEQKANPSMRIVNRKGLTPFTLSVWLGDVEMYRHIARKYLSEVLLKYGDSKLQFIDLEQIDSFRMEESDEDSQIPKDNPQNEALDSRSREKWDRIPATNEGNCSLPLHANPGWRSAFEIILEKNLKEFADDEIFEYLIANKWSAFGQWMYFVLVVVPYLGILVLYVTATLMRMEELMKLRYFYADNPGLDKLDHVIYGSDAFQNDSGYMFLILASVGACIMLYIAWIWMRVRFRHLDQDHNG